MTSDMSYQLLYNYIIERLIPIICNAKYVVNRRHYIYVMRPIYSDGVLADEKAMSRI